VLHAGPAGVRRQPRRADPAPRVQADGAWVERKLDPRGTPTRGSRSRGAGIRYKSSVGGGGGGGGAARRARRGGSARSRSRGGRSAMTPARRPRFSAQLRPAPQRDRRERQLGRAPSTSAATTRSRRAYLREATSPGMAGPSRASSGGVIHPPPANPAPVPPWAGTAGASRAGRVRHSEPHIRVSRLSPPTFACRKSNSRLPRGDRRSAAVRAAAQSGACRLYTDRRRRVASARHADGAPPPAARPPVDDRRHPRRRRAARGMTSTSSPFEQKCAGAPAARVRGRYTIGPSVKVKLRSIRPDTDPRTPVQAATVAAVTAGVGRPAAAYQHRTGRPSRSRAHLTASHPAVGLRVGPR
jgi:hypothetical protein